MDAKPKNSPPHGTEPYDLATGTDIGALSPQQQQSLNEFKRKTRSENEQYLREHPEVECMVSDFLREVLRNRPENIRNFAADHFTKPTLPMTLHTLLENRLNKTKEHKILKTI